MSKLRYHLLVIFCLAFLSHVQATHNRAGEITYKWIGPGLHTYQIKVTTYTNIGGTNVADRCEDTVYFGDGTHGLVLRSNGPSNGSCSPNGSEGQPLPGGMIKLNEYVTTHTYPGPGNYKISMEDPNRNAGIINIPNSVNQVFYIESFLVIPAFGTGKNNSPILPFPPIDNGCVGKCFLHNPGAYDMDGDSLSYELTNCRGHLGAICPGYTFPATGGGTFQINSTGGTLSWCLPQMQGAYSMAMIIKEWRKNDDCQYFLIGSILRDMQVDVGACSNNSPGINTVSDVYVLEGSTVSKTITATDPDMDNLTLEAKGNPFTVIQSNATFSSFSSLTSVTGLFTWQTNFAHVRREPYQVTLKVIDNDPSVKLMDFKTFNVKVIPDAPMYLTTNPYTDHIILTWKKPNSYSTSGSNPFRSYNIYRKDSLSNWIHANNETIPPAYTGFSYIGSTSGNITDTTFFDYNGGNAFIPGRDYSYLVLAQYTDCATSYVSNASGNQIYVGINEHILTNDEVQIFPNPAGDDLTIAFSQPEPEWLTIALMDITGRTIKTLISQENITQQNTFHLNLKSVNQGIYFLKITDRNNLTVIKKIIKQ